MSTKEADFRGIDNFIADFGGKYYRIYKPDKILQSYIFSGTRAESYIYE